MNVTHHKYKLKNALCKLSCTRVVLNISISVIVLRESNHDCPLCDKKLPMKPILQGNVTVLYAAVMLEVIISFDSLLKTLFGLNE